MTVDWSKVAEKLEDIARNKSDLLDKSQRDTLAELARRIRAGRRAALLADEVGMGKTRIAVALIEAVRHAGGRSAIVLPAGLGAQWRDELRRFNPDDKTLLPLRSYDGFIAGFLEEEKAEGSEGRKRNHKKWLMDRRQQRELPERLWADEDILMISHTFANMRFQAGSKSGWRTKLLPAVRCAPRGDCSDKKDDMLGATYEAAKVIVAAIREHKICEHKLKSELAENHSDLKSSDFRKQLLPLIGYGLGRFDLVVIDEAHKARGEDSSLSRLLGPLIWESDTPFRLGMTATPVELDAAQWINTLDRICGGDNGKSRADLEEPIRKYVDAVRSVQVKELDEDLVKAFKCAASEFRKALSPYVLRRDKRDDPDYEGFPKEYDDYRKVTDIRVSLSDSTSFVSVSDSTTKFSHDWLRRFCAAEAISMSREKDPQVKRLRIALAQGYSLDAVFNNLRASSGAERDEKKAEAREGGPSTALSETVESQGVSKIWLDALGEDTPDLYSHPAILATVRRIEEYAKKGEKVLVFGRFLKPLDALTRLLNAREMLRRLAAGQHWPARSVGEKSEAAAREKATAGEKNEAAARAAMRDPEFSSGPADPADIESLNRKLAEQYGEWEKRRSDELRRLHRKIEKLAAQDSIAALLVRFLQRDGDESHGNIGTLLEALEARRETPGRQWTSEEMLKLFRTLCAELAIDDSAETSSKENLESRLKTYLDNYSGREGNFARMMSGGTAPQTRRFLQAAFNRPSSWPMVLVAQSRVGREGLNLHEACRTVILLHAEWNPGIVEQQIGRVDRKNSRWLRDLHDWRKGGAKGEPPRIRIHPVVVSGTYDDHNWQVLKARWLELRAQLHGDVLPQLADRPALTPEKQKLVECIRKKAPRFAPPGSKE